MRRNYILFCVCLCFAVFLGGCMSVANSPNSRFYMLQAIDENQAVQKFNLEYDAIIGVGPVKIPDYQDRPQIVTRNKDNTLNFAQFDRWGEVLDLGLARLLNADLRIMLPQAKIEMYPWNTAIPVRYQVIVEVAQLESRLDKDMFLVVQWSIIDLHKDKMVFIKRSEFRQPVNPSDYFGLTNALSTACASLSSEIAGALSSLDGKTKE
ncbi:MAG: PqiC family protein [Candidatus Omnitrophica bacterium]|nr:PqiC family protein [Candidatus Omnitrophota bacterium]